MKYVIFILICSFGLAQAQVNLDDFVDQPKYILKFAPRIFSPRFTYEKVLNSNSSVGFDTRLYAYWLPQGFRVDVFYRRYFKDKGPLGFYIQPKVALGYFDYNIVDLKTNGLQAGGGFSVGGQFNIGKKNAVIDIFAGLQLITPLYLNVEPVNNNSGYRNYGYNVIHYTLLAFPIDLGIRFGFIKMKKVPVNTIYNPEMEY